MQRALYQLLLLIALPFIPFRLFWRGLKQPAYWQNIGERFGWYQARKGSPLVWIHAVSVGEVRAAQPLLEALAQAHPAHAFLITVMTPTGRETAQSLFGERVTIVYLPYDYDAPVTRFLDYFRPQLGLIMETELWPNLLRECAVRGLPVALVNARLSEKSARGYQRFAALTAEALGSLTFVSAQSESDASRLTALGARKVEVVGNLKFDMPLDADLITLGNTWRTHLKPGRRTILLASSREGEEAQVLSAWQNQPANIREQHLLVLVPRHPQRFDEVAALVTAQGLSMARRSQSQPDASDVWLGDSMGEMAAYYALADVVIMGGSLLNFGSQNLIEPCSQGRPVVLGPSTFNFAEAAALATAEGAAKQAADAAAAVSMALGWVNDDAEMQRAAAAALRFASRHRGATTRTMALLAPLVR